ncbi:MAG: DUF6737 family protein [Synechococcus sp.]
MSIPNEPTDLWALKPWWCQPWSIVLTGVVVPLASWVGWHRWWVTLPLLGGVLIWWLLFLVLAPAAYRQAAGDARKAGGLPPVEPMD